MFPFFRYINTSAAVAVNGLAHESLLDVLCTCHTSDWRSWATRVVGSGLADVGTCVYRHSCLAADRLALIHTFTPTFRRLCDQGLQAINQPIQNNVVAVAFVCLRVSCFISEFPCRKSLSYSDQHNYHGWIQTRDPGP